MKMSRLISMVILGVALVATPVYAQRGGGGSRGGGGGSHSSSSSSRGGGYSGSSHSSASSSRSSSSYSSSRSSSSYSSPSRSSSSHSSYSSPSYSSPSSSSSRSYSSPSAGRSNSSYSTPSRGSSNRPSGAAGYTNRNAGATGGVNTSRGANDHSVSRTGSVPGEIRARAGRSEGMPKGEGGRGSMGTTGRPNGVAPAPEGGYARPGHPEGPMPPAHRPMHPAPYFYHPHHHCMVHCHQLYWDPCFYHDYYWPGFWHYCGSYWYDYHVTDVVVVREYVRDTYHMDLITYAMNGDFMYALVNDPDGHTYIQVYDHNDKLLAEQKVSRKYCKMEVDPQNGGCWIMKKRDKDPLLFLYSGGQLLIYEADK